MALMGVKPNPPELHLSSLQDRIQVMDAQGIDVEALSINPFWYKADRDTASKIIAIQNEGLAKICAAQPERFVAFATVALQHPELAVEQLVEGVKKYGLRGLSVGGSVNGEELAAEKFHPVWAKAEELGLLVFIHPQGTAELRGRLAGNGGLDNVIGNPLETTIALSHLIFEGTLDRFPGLKICAAHGGGYLPSYAARSDAGCKNLPGPLREAAQEASDRISQADVFRFDRLHPGGAGALDSRGRLRPHRLGYRLSVSLDEDRGGSHPRHARPERCRACRDARRDGRAAARHQVVAGGGKRPPRALAQHVRRRGDGLKAHSWAARRRNPAARAAT
jgi:predicted TIM-barrel fold metal-dependent hydrolase